ncbi:MAG: hypothetical protein KME07_22965 [Pegethrix bostrychoides GSE-TBD4-15B]|jgi:hypothetical protein|uniref:Nif11 domain-containing protein n=1 Tax=Pegethrix bostrychoides GSE-TBD4-15B TaxID=2839662 RepID=A0A951U6U3_9CYAN|nr:hypothetical protein [Pegethrix bostrychoides GSE-TBD4-15B]
MSVQAVFSLLQSIGSSETLQADLVKLGAAHNFDFTPEDLKAGVAQLASGELAPEQLTGVAGGIDNGSSWEIYDNTQA